MYYYIKQLEDDGNYTYMSFSFQPILNERMTPMTEEEYIEAISAEVEETPNEEIEGQTEICFN